MDDPTALDVVASSIAHCSLCGLCENRTKTVPGAGSVNAKIVFIGEAPGKNEDLAGIPFCGASGKLLNSLLASINLDRDDVFITNIVKCRPSNNRDPLPSEKSICASTYLEEQLRIIRPSIIVTLGRHALNHFIPNEKISEIHGKAIDLDGRIFLPLYHPAVAIYDRKMRATLEEDFANIPKLLLNYEHHNQ